MPTRYPVDAPDTLELHTLACLPRLQRGIRSTSCLIRIPQSCSFLPPQLRRRLPPRPLTLIPAFATLPRHRNNAYGGAYVGRFRRPRANGIVRPLPWEARLLRQIAERLPVPASSDIRRPRASVSPQLASWSRWRSTSHAQAANLASRSARTRSERASVPSYSASRTASAASASAFKAFPFTRRKPGCREAHTPGTYRPRRRPPP